MTLSIAESRGTFRPMLRLVIPVLAEQLLHALVMLVDVWLTGRYLKHAPELAAIGLIAYTMWFLTSLFDFVSTGATAMTARFVGSRNIQRACHTTNQALLVGAVLAVLVTALGYFLIGVFVRAMQLEPDAARLAVRYIGFILPVLPAIMVQRVGIACLRGAGDMITVFWVMAVVNLVNIGVSCSLVIGWAGLPRLGWDGIALGTAMAHFTGGLLVIAMLLKGRSGLKLRLRWLQPELQSIRRLLRIGIPGGIDTLFIISCHLVFVSLINSLGNAAAAAHNVAIRIESLAFLPGAAFSVAATTLAGQYLGAKQYDRAGRSVMMTCAIACGIMLAVGVVFYVGGRELAGIFLDASQGKIADQAADLLRIASFAMLPLGLQMVLTGALRGAGDTRWPLLFSIIGFLGIRIPLTYLFAYHYGWGVAGAWYAMLIDVGIRCLMVSYRFLHGGWKRTVV